MWGDQRDGWGVELVQYAAFLIVFVAIIFGLTAVSN